MRELFSVSVMLVCVCFAFSQGDIELKKEYVYNKLDKKTQQVFVYQDGNLIEKGIIVNGKREGVWQSFDEVGRITAEASFADGKKNGVWLIYKETKLQYVLHYQNDKRVGANDLLVAQ